MIVGLALSTFVTRTSFLIAGAKLRLGARVEVALRYAPVCTLAAIIVPDILIHPPGAAIDLEAGSLSENGIRRRDEPAVDHGVVLDVRRNLRLKAHGVEQPVVPKVHLADVHAIVERADEERQG